MDENKKTFEEVNKQVEKKIEALTKEGVKQTNVDYLGKLIDIHKDIKEEENMMYRDYDNYGNFDNYGARMRDSRGRFMESGNYGTYGKRGYDRKYRGDDMIDEMSMHYGDYMSDKENGRYGSPETKKSLEYMLKSAEDFFKHLKNEASSQEEVEMVKRTARKIADM